MKNKPNISKSTINAFNDVLYGKTCGIAFEAQYVDKLFQTPSSEAALKGKWFEYMVTGYVSDGEEVPTPGVVSAGKKDIPIWLETKIPSANGRAALPKVLVDLKKNLSADYKSLFDQAMFCRAAFKKRGFKIIDVGLVVEHEMESGVNNKMIIDVLAEDSNGSKCIIDIKSTALINDKWTGFGWELGGLANRYGLMMQPVHYKWMWKEKYGEDIPFYFFIHSSKNNVERKIIEVDVTEARMKQHDPEAIMQEIEDYKDIGFPVKAVPELCQDCPYHQYLVENKKKCKHRELIPEIEYILVDANLVSDA